MCTCSYETLGKEVDRCRRTAITIVSQLNEIGLIRIESVPRRSTRIYAPVNIDDLPGAMYDCTTVVQCMIAHEVDVETYTTNDNDHTNDGCHELSIQSDPSEARGGGDAENTVSAGLSGHRENRGGYDTAPKRTRRGQTTSPRRFVTR